MGTGDSLNNLEAISDSESEERLSKATLESLSDTDGDYPEAISDTEKDSTDNESENVSYRSYDNTSSHIQTLYQDSASYTTSSTSNDYSPFNEVEQFNLDTGRTNVGSTEANEYSETYGSKYLSEYLQYHPDKSRQLSMLTDHASRRRKLEEIFPENELKTKLAALETTQISIEGFANGVIQYSYPPGPILQLLLDVFVSLPVNASSVRLAIFYVYNHLIQTFTNEKIWKYSVSFQYSGLDRFCIPAIIHTNRIKCNNIIHICNCINIWRQRAVYTREVCDKLEHISTNTSIIKNAPSVNHNFNVNDELGYLNVLYHIFKMPLVNEAYNKAVSNCNVERLVNCDPERDGEYMDELIELNKEQEFNEAGRLSGQELIIVNSACLDLGALIKENDHNFGVLSREISKLEALLNRK
ncbi:conserved hypothetical protein [Theileria orientalis strain Shintoku]|uniref:CID domain-containing protein n=1 Tax=Theileria orientalis strain Shintoku TaxID=869250 RepID=J4C8Q5_THEOR|nr:conserved hypothetical protein [Theileria orientalis strain Shintoku]PVC52754.1 hypothetical protein MACL_00000516 [Theileria orientalis]BAM41198.1 conserved hypothetical protein [Theileria orientalis strain Shintoku]|eukprot:XP_009691499.1 conserved hypothetical protein [Theileria orientalis strain Shintoku]